MDNYQKVEQLVNKTGCSYEEAKTALEGSGWDMLDAVISLEREGKVEKATAVQRTEEPIEITAEIPAEKISASRQDAYRTDEGRGAEEGNAGRSGKGEEKPKRVRKIWNRIKSMMINNRMIVLKGSGQQILDLPILVPVIALIAFFWATLILAGAAMLLGCRFHFEGEDLGKTNINSTMDKATDYAEKVKKDFAGRVNEKQDTDN